MCSLLGAGRRYAAIKFPRSIHVKKLSFFDWLFGRTPAPPTPNTALRTQSYATEKTIELSAESFKVYKIEECPPLTTTLSKEDAVKYFMQMQTIRRMENSAASLYKEKIIRGFCHLYIGQEACAVGMKAAMRDKDNVITAYRCHAWCYLMGISPLGILAELTGRSTGCARGKGGSMHMYSPHFFGGNGIVGAQVPLGVGIGLACQYKGDGGICLALYGDGAANQGQIFEVYNIACLKKLPVIFICENNQYGMGTKTSRSACSHEYYTRGDYIPGIWVDGMNILAVRNATKMAVEHATKVGPIVMEMYTYRYMGHSMSDPGTSYRSREEVQEVRQKRDPITTFKELCTTNGLVTAEEFKEMEDKIKKEIDDVVKVSKSDKEIELKELVADIYSNNLEPKIRGATGYNLQHFQINKGANH